MFIIYKTKVERKRMAEFLGCCMGDDFKPYMPNKGDDEFWTVDRGNNWKVKFFDEDLNKMEIVHRYRNGEAIKSLSEWVAFRTGGTLEVEKPKEKKSPQYSNQGAVDTGQGA